MMKIKQYDYVELKNGQKGWVVEIFDDKNFMFEATDDDDLILPTVPFSDIEKNLTNLKNGKLNL
ncbi:MULTISPECIES: hypothetical protein [unclassified Lactococcus]|uniref:hypothetical protein n=1 Tax=unclassified Lactococcus TaxID=2643510 RepID=UPI0011CA3A5E|nr:MULTISPECIES: hypothetical protein [unclassified Lactococcus]MQW23827.1 hypothetical protein [Lactococcus sp. dk101]TXK37348.1 hypothetical protein FVP42_08970 [Lactococcus sp. dk310]TXK48660.1 hypothetical protein FVP43_08945 [Lactococcus sp. dk322]